MLLVVAARRLGPHDDTLRPVGEVPLGLDPAQSGKHLVAALVVIHAAGRGDEALGGEVDGKTGILNGHGSIP